MRVSVGQPLLRDHHDEHKATTTTASSEDTADLIVLLAVLGPILFILTALIAGLVLGITRLDTETWHGTCLLS